jgi:hypothetical protein
MTCSAGESETICVSSLQFVLQPFSEAVFTDKRPVIAAASGKRARRDTTLPFLPVSVVEMAFGTKQA